MHGSGHSSRIEGFYRLSREERLICGLAVETPMTVKLELDVFNFPLGGEK